MMHTSRTLAATLLSLGLSSTLLATIRITEICPKPSAADPIGAESGWLELTNTGDEPDNLSNYAIARFNRGKAFSAKKVVKLPNREVSVGERVVIYTSEDVRFYTHEDVQLVTVGDKSIYVYGAKVNPKKYPCVYLTSTDGKTVYDQFIVPVDIKENESIAPGNGETSIKTIVGAETPYQYKVNGSDEWLTGIGTLVISKNPIDLLKDRSQLGLSFTSDTDVTVGESIEDDDKTSRSNAYQLPGADANANIGVTASCASKPKGLYTVSLWFKTRGASNPSSSDTQTHGMPLFDCRPSGSGKTPSGMILFVNDDNQITIQPRDTARKIQTLASDSDVFYNDAMWHHVVLVAGQVSGEALTLYVDGIRLIDSSLNVDATLQGDCPFYFGRAGDSTSWHAFNGALSDIKVYDGALSPAEVIALYNSENTKEAATPVTEIPGELNTTHVYAEADAEKMPAVEAKVAVERIEGSTVTPMSTNSSVKPTFDDKSSTLTWSIAESDQPSTTLVTAQESTAVGGTTRVLLPTITPGAENDLTNATPYGPNIGPAYGIKTDDGDLSQQQKAPVQAATDLTITFEVHPLTAEDENQIQTVFLRYRADLGAVSTIPMTKDPEGSATWTATIPGKELPAAGHLIQWAGLIVDASSRIWQSPSFHNPDDGYEWYGTIVAPTDDQKSANEKMQTFHLFGTATALDNMNKQYDAISANMPYGARIAIYDGQTNTYYDNVRADLRGNTTAGFKKKSHGLRFNKVQPLVCTNPFEEDPNAAAIEVRKTSFIAEYSDPAFIRQSLAFWMFRKAGNLVPFDYPVRLQLNGVFYQLAFHSARFTDELIEDGYGLDPYGYAYKNVGTFNSSGTTSAGGIEKKTPDDGNEKDTSVLSTFCSTFTSGTDASKTAVVAKSFDLPAWFNYMATSRLTHENDDIWANLSAYYDINGTGTWMPLAYDHNLSFGAWYYGDDTGAGRIGCRPDDDNFKSHPFYGGMTIRAHRYNTNTVLGNGNYAYEAIFQNEKYRRLYLRRLRTVMDEILHAPGTAKDESAFWAYATTLQDAIADDAVLDRETWGTEYTGTVIYVWKNAMTLDEGMTDLWDNYIEPRRKHLYDTHSVTNALKEIGYGTNLLNAGIPESQAQGIKLSFGNAESTDGTSIGFDASQQVLILENDLDDAVDVSGWTLTGAVTWTLPAGSVIDKKVGDVPGRITIVADRKAYIEANAKTITDDIILSGADTQAANPAPVFSTEAVDLTLTDADGAISASVTWALPTAESAALRVLEVMPNPKVDNDSTGEYIVLKNISEAEIDLTGCTIWCAKVGKTLAQYAALPSQKLAAGVTYTYTNPSNAVKMTDGEVNMEVRDSLGRVCQTLYWSDKWYPQMDGAGASLIAVIFDASNTESSGWKPSFDLPEDSKVATATTTAIEAHPAIATWLSNLTAAGETPLSNFAGTSEDLTLYYMVDVVPTSEPPEVALEIDAITLDANGNITLTPSLTAGQTGKNGEVNAILILYTYETLASDPVETDLGTPTFEDGKCVLLPANHGTAKFFKFELRAK